MARNAEVEVKLADTKMVMDLVQSANDVVSSAVEHQAGCRASGIDFCVVCANVGDMVKPLREFFRRWCQNDPPAPPIEPTAECRAAMAANARDAQEASAGAPDGNETWLGRHCIGCNQLTRLTRPAEDSQGGQVYECPKCAGRALPETDPVPALNCYYCHHEATEFVREHNATGIPVCADHGHGPIQARDDSCEMCKSKKGPIIRIPTGGGQFVTCIPCAKAMRVALKEVIEEVEEGKQ